MMKNLGFYQIDPIKYSKRFKVEIPEYWLDTIYFQFYMVTLNEIDVGYFAFRMHKKELIAKVQQVHVTEREREKGLGRIIVYHMEKLAKDLGTEKMYVFDKCEEFWTKMGYTKTEDITPELIEISYKEDDNDRNYGFMVKNL